MNLEYVQNSSTRFPFFNHNGKHSPSSSYGRMREIYAFICTSAAMALFAESCRGRWEEKPIATNSEEPLFDGFELNISSCLYHFPSLLLCQTSSSFSSSFFKIQRRTSLCNPQCI